MTIITLETWEYVHACNVGIARFAANWGKEDAPHYKKELMEDFTEANTYVAKIGRQCRICNKKRSRIHRAKKDTTS